jgi:mRNA interferase RelE/StbE
VLWQIIKLEIFIKESIWKDLRKVPKRDLKRILSRVKKLGDDPRPIECEKLTCEELYRIRQSKYRIVHSVRDNELTVWVIKIGYRKGVYR